MEGNLNVLLGVPGADVIRGFVILGADCKNGKKYREPRRSDGFRRPRTISCIPRAIFQVHHQFGLEIVDIHDEPPKGLRDFLVSSEEPGDGQRGDDKFGLTTMEPLT